MMIKVHLLFLLLLPVIASAQMIDGPYVFYRSKKIYVKSITREDGTYKAVIDSFPKTEHNDLVLSVHIADHPEWGFKVTLKKKIEIPSAVTHDRYIRENKMLVLSDIEGEFEPFRNLLLAAHVIDTAYNWVYGKGSLVLAGDLFDRGLQVAPFLWLLYKLEDEAMQSGGHVFVILGNHDIMNLSGDFRYVQQVYGINAALMGEGYVNLYSDDTELGHWLRSKNIIEKVNNFLIMHAGVSSQVLARQMEITDINWNCRPYFDKPDDAPGNLKVFLNDDGVFWYRGYFFPPKASEGLVDSTLSFYRVNKIIVGHDIIEHIAMFYHGKVIGVDVNEHEGRHEALLIDKDKYFVIDDKGHLSELLSGD